MTEVGLSALADTCYDGDLLAAGIGELVSGWSLSTDRRRGAVLGTRALVDALDSLAGGTLQQRFAAFEHEVWPRWRAGGHGAPPYRWSAGVRAAVIARAVRPGWQGVMPAISPLHWIKPLPESDPLHVENARLSAAINGLHWARHDAHHRAQTLGLRILLASGYARLEEITEDDLRGVAVEHLPRGIDALDGALCALGIFNRTPKRGPTRLMRTSRVSAGELADRDDIPERFRAVTALYLDNYAQRVSDHHTTMRNRAAHLARFWRFIDQEFPEVTGAHEVLPVHGRAYVPHAIAAGRGERRGGGDEDTQTAHGWLSSVRVFFTDLCSWATEPGSPLAGHAPPAIPLTYHDLRGVGFEKVRRRVKARMTATVLDLEREIPNIRARAFTAWQEAADAYTAASGDRRMERAERDAFWDWALLELLVQSGLRVEEAGELTTLDVLKRHLPDGRAYYLLHVKPSKFDRARVIPIGDGLGRVIADIIAHVRRFYGSPSVPACDNWDVHERRPLPRAPYLLQGAQHPSVIKAEQIRTRLRRISEAAGAGCADGSPLVLHPHDCRRIFASEHLNHDTPPHVIQALLGHAAVDTVMTYAKLYPTTLVEAYRKAVRGTYESLHGAAALRNPTAEEWAEFAAGCNLRDMGTHLCALPTGDHCSRGLVCLGCTHAQPKKSAAPIFRRMLISHRRSLADGERTGEPAGQLAARRLEIQRIEGALGRAEQLPADVAAMIEGAAA